MSTFKKTFCLLLFFCTTPLVYGQHEIKPVEGYAPQIGIMVDMLEELKQRIVEDLADLDQKQTDFLFDEKANSIGAIIMHLAAIEIYYQVETLEGRTWTQEEAAFWETASDLGPEAREKINGKPIQYYLDLWDQVREKTLRGLKAKNNEWFAATIEEGMNNHWVWFHVMEHQANHMGQIALIRKRLPE